MPPKAKVLYKMVEETIDTNGDPTKADACILEARRTECETQQKKRVKFEIDERN